MPKVHALLLSLLMGFSCASYAQIYKSIDADGNVVFSDTPPVTGGEEIQVPEANVADPVEVPVNASPESVPESAPAPASEVTEEQPQPEVSTSDGDDDDGLNTRQKVRRAKRLRNNGR